MNYIKSNLNLCQVADKEVADKFSPRKISSLRLSEVYSALGEDSKSSRVSNCGSYLEYHITEEVSKLHSANFCKDRLCPMCNWRRSKKIFATLSPVMDKLQESGYKFLFLTLTVKNCKFSELSDTLSVLLDGWRNLSRKFRYKAYSDIVGSFRTLEITINKEKCTFHPHLHCILAVKSSYFTRGYVKQSEWSELWRNCCNLDYNPVVDIRTVKSGNLDVKQGVDVSFRSALKEVTKYVSKGSDYLDGEFEEILLKVYYLLDALSGRRLCSLSGVFKEVAKNLRLDDDIENGDLVHLDDAIRTDLEYLTVRYGWRSGFYVREVSE